MRKSYRYKQTYEVLGAEVHGHSGRVGTPLDKLRQFFLLAGSFLLNRYVTKWELQSIVGAFVNPFMHKRPCMSVFSKLYVIINNMPNHEKFMPWNAAVYDEILFAVLLLPFAEADIRAPASCVVSATDATVVRAGSCTAQVPPLLADMFYSRAGKRGEHVRLDWLEHELVWLPCALAPPSEELDSLVRAIPWELPRSNRFDHVAHMNIQEVLACAHEISS